MYVVPGDRVIRMNASTPHRVKFVQGLWMQRNTKQLAGFRDDEAKLLRLSELSGTIWGILLHQARAGTSPSATNLHLRTFFSGAHPRPQILRNPRPCLPERSEQKNNFCDKFRCFSFTGRRNPAVCSALLITQYSGGPLR